MACGICLPRADDGFGNLDALNLGELLGELGPVFHRGERLWSPMIGRGGLRSPAWLILVCSPITSEASFCGELMTRCDVSPQRPLFHFQGSGTTRQRPLADPENVPNPFRKSFHKARSIRMVRR